MSEHVLTRTSIQRYTAEVLPADVTEDVRSLDVGMEYQEEVRSKWECSCGETFYRDHTAHEHILGVTQSNGEEEL